MEETVSVIMPVFNSSDTISRAIESVLKQSYPIHEIICVDDCSTDDSRTKIEQWQRTHPIVRYLRLDENGGPSVARNFGLAAATGQWVAIIDSDDAWKDGRIEAMMDAAVRYQADIVCDTPMLYDAVAGCEIRPAITGLEKPVRVSLECFLENSFLGSFQYALLKYLAKREFLVKNKVCYEKNLRFGEDLLFFIDALIKNGQMILIKYVGYIYSVQVGPISKKKNINSQTKSNFLYLAEILERYEFSNYKTLSCEEKKILNKLVNHFKIIDKSNAARNFRRQKNYIKYITMMLDVELVSTLIRIRIANFAKDRLRS